LIKLQLNTTNFFGKLQLYGSNGALLRTAQDNFDNLISYTATNCGSFAVLVSSYTPADTGTYGLTVNGLSDGLKLCPPVISGARLTLNGVGGDAGTNFIVYSSPDVMNDFSLWTPVLTNQFDQFGVLTYTNVYDPAAQQLYFRLIEMK
jgi:hypothetical protein